MYSTQINHIKILYVRSTIGMYGAEQVIYNILPVLNKSCDVSLLTLEDSTPESEVLRNLINDKFVDNFHFCPHGRIDFKVIRGIKLLIKENQFNVIHTHDYKSLFYVKIASINTKVKIVHHIHGALGNSYSEKVYGMIEYWQMRNVKKIFTVSAEQKKTS